MGGGVWSFDGEMKINTCGGKLVRAILSTTHAAASCSVVFPFILFSLGGLDETDGRTEDEEREKKNKK